VARPRVRIATLNDLDLLVVHRRGMWIDIAHFSEEQLAEGDRVYRRWARARLKSGTLVGLILETPKGEAVATGCLWLMPRPPRPMGGGHVVPYLLSMYTKPAHRGRGYATRIVREAVRWARGRGYDAITLHASDYGQSIYRREGFGRTMEMRLRLRKGGRVRWKARPRGKRTIAAPSPRRAKTVRRVANRSPKGPKGARSKV
jgi:GNAT superfamily N-acetyltransferase